MVTDCYKDHFSLRVTKDIKDICESFFKDKKVNINHLNYIQKNADGSVFYLCSNHDWIKHYYDQKYPSIGAFEQNDTFSKDKYVLWSSLDCGDKILQDSKKIISVEHGITIIEKLNKGIAYFNMGNSNSNASVINDYINNLEILNEFVMRFFDIAKPLLNQSQNNCFILPKSTGEDLSLCNIIHESTELKLKKFYFGDNKKDYLNQGEFICVQWYLRGKTSAEISQILSISKRTVETHIANIKRKLNCRNLMQLGYIIALIQSKNLGFIPHPHKN